MFRGAAHGRVNELVQRVAHDHADVAMTHLDADHASHGPTRASNVSIHMGEIFEA